MDVVHSSSMRQLSERRGHYGFDAPYVVMVLGGIGLVFLLAGILCIWGLNWLIVGIICLIYAFFMLFMVISYSYTTRRGKFQVWAEILEGLQLGGDEKIIDLGCGRGAVLLMAAKLLPDGKATGIDLWNTNDQSGNALEVTTRNAELEGVAERVELHTGDMRKLPFANDTFDVILSSLAIHNIPEPADRAQAIDEAVRVLRPGGRLKIVDFRETRAYERRLRELGMLDVTYRALDWRFWYGSPWTATKLVSARKPA